MYLTFSAHHSIQKRDKQPWFSGPQMNKLYCNSRTQWTLVLCFIPRGSAGNDMEAEVFRSCCHDNSQRSMGELECAVPVKARTIVEVYQFKILNLTM